MKKLTVLHSNDMHGAFLPEEKNGKKIGGLARIAGYVKKVREEEPNVIYAIAGDMFKGSIIDSEYRGLSTIELINLLAPDVACIGNHEVDYGVGHMLFAERCASFPLINANMRLVSNRARLLTPYKILEVGGIKIMFIGLVTPTIVTQTKNDELVSAYLEVTDAAKEVRVICDTYRTPDIQYTVLLTHLGFEEDCQLAAELPAELGISMIIGGHSHTFLEEPCVVGNIPIVQVGIGTGKIGRADFTFDEETGKPLSFTWKSLPVDEDLCPADEQMETVLSTVKTDLDKKYLRVFGMLKRKLTHPVRYKETELGNLMTDLLLKYSLFDIVMMGSGSIRKKELGPVITVQDFRELYPYDEGIYLVQVTGKQFRRMLTYVYREEALTPGAHSEYYQYSKGCRFVWSQKKNTFLEFALNGQEITDERELLLALQAYHLRNFEHCFGFPVSEVAENLKPREVIHSVTTVYEELFAEESPLDAHVEGRLELRDLKFPEPEPGNTEK